MTSIPEPKNYRSLQGYWAAMKKFDKKHWTNMVPGGVKDTCMLIEIIKIGNPKQVKSAERQLIDKTKRLQKEFERRWELEEKLRLLEAGDATP